MYCPSPFPVPVEVREAIVHLLERGLGADVFHVLIVDVQVLPHGGKLCSPQSVLVASLEAIAEAVGDQNHKY